MIEKRPPVFFTIAALRHDPILALGEYIPKIQDALRRQGYSGPVEVETAHADVDDTVTKLAQTYTVFNSERTAAFTFHEGGVYSYHTSAYSSRRVLFDAFRLGLTVLHSHVGLNVMSRVGVRMLDLIRPSDTGHELSDFVSPNLLGFRALKGARDWTKGIGVIEQRFVEDEAEVIAKLACLPDGFGIDAQLFNAIKGHALTEHVTAKPNVLHCILDIDGGTRTIGTPADRSFDLELAMSELTGHKDRISQLFRAAVTPLALDVWGLEQ